MAVIVILAIIALIATSIILNMIGNAKKNSAKSSAYGYIDAIEYNTGLSEVDNRYTKIEDGDNIEVNDITGLKMKGKNPDFGVVTINKGKVESATLCIGGYNVEYQNKEATVNGKCDASSIVKLENIKTDITKIEISPNEAYQVEIELEPENATYKNVSYSVADENVATVSNTGLVTGKKTGTTTLTISGSNNKKVTINIEIKEKTCKRAIKLHTEECKQTSNTEFCSAAGYTTSGSKGTTTITYGNLGTNGTLASGDAFDCDVTGNGDWGRFYYVTDKTTTTTNDTAVLVYYNNTTNGVADNTTSSLIAYDTEHNSTGNGDNWYGPVTAYTNLPSTTQWSNSKIILPGTRQITNELGGKTTSEGNKTIQSFTYTNKAARFLTVQEVNYVCNIIVGSYTIGELDKCNYLMENTIYSNPNIGTTGYWLETPVALSSNSIWRISGGSSVYSGKANIAGNNGVRPVIEVLKTDIDY